MVRAPGSVPGVEHLREPMDVGDGHRERRVTEDAERFDRGHRLGERDAEADVGAGREGQTAIAQERWGGPIVLGSVNGPVTEVSTTFDNGVRSVQRPNCT